MKSLVIATLSLFLIWSCQNKPQQTEVAPITDTTEIPKSVVSGPIDIDNAIDIEDASRWLTEVIENHLNEGGYPMEDICTPKYFEYKTDATESGYDGGMTEDDFKKKWASRYNVKHAGIGTAFLISGQDNGKVKVTKCTLKSPNIFSVIISDPDMNMKYHRDIKIVPVGKAYLIDDIVEFD